jgi:hypothetical protein
MAAVLMEGLAILTLRQYGLVAGLTFLDLIVIQIEVFVFCATLLFFSFLLLYLGLQLNFQLFVLCLPCFLLFANAWLLT